MVVFATGQQGFFVQLDPNSPGCSSSMGTQYSGIFVEAEAGVQWPGIANMLEITTATVANVDGQIRLENAAWKVVGDRHGLPATQTTVDQVVGGGANSPYEATLVHLEDLEVTNRSPQPGAGDTDTPNHEFIVDSQLRIDDFAGYTFDPVPPVGSRFESLRGVVAWRNSLIKLGPRTGIDVTAEMNTPAPLDTGNGGQDGGSGGQDGGSGGQDGGNGGHDTGNNTQDSNCDPDCFARECGPDPVCGISCGTCTQGVCTASGACHVEQGGDPPSIIAITTDITTLHPGESVTFRVQVTDADGDLTGGKLLTPTGVTYAQFQASTTSPDVWAVDVSWSELNFVEEITFPAGGTSRDFTVEFEDAAGNIAVDTTSLGLECSASSEGACSDGACVALDTVQNCTACGNDCETQFNNLISRVQNCADCYNIECAPLTDGGPDQCGIGVQPSASKALCNDVCDQANCAVGLGYYTDGTDTAPAQVSCGQLPSDTVTDDNNKTWDYTGQMLCVCTL